MYLWYSICIIQTYCPYCFLAFEFYDIKAFVMIRFSSYFFLNMQFVVARARIFLCNYNPTYLYGMHLPSIHIFYVGNLKYLPSICSSANWIGLLVKIHIIYYVDCMYKEDHCTQNPFQILYLLTQIQIDIVYWKPDFKKSPHTTQITNLK